MLSTTPSTCASGYIIYMAGVPHDCIYQGPAALLQVLVSRIAGKLGAAVSQATAAAAAAVVAAASSGVSAELPVLPDAARRDIGATALKLPRYQRLIKAGLHTIVANSSR